VAHDSTFAMAWRKLGTMLFNAGERQDRAEIALTKAFALRDRLTFRERKLTENSYYSDARGMNDSALAALQSLLVEYPSDSWALNNVGVVHEMTGDELAAEEAFVHSAALEPENILAWRNIFTSRLNLARFDSAANTLKLMKGRFPPNSALEELDILFDLGRRDFAAGETRIREQMQRFRSDPRAQARLARMLAGVLAVRGKLAEADRAFIASAELRTAQGQPGQALVEQARRAVPIAMYRGDQSGAAARLEATFRASPVEGIAERDRPLPGLIYAAVQVGDRTRAEALLRDLERNPGTVPGRAVPFVRAISRGQVLSMRKETLPQALEAFRTAQRGPCSYCVDVSMGDAFDRAGMPDSALAHYQRWGDAGEDFWDGGRYTIWQPVAYFRLGELYQEKGDTAHATEFYGKFAELWKDADPELQPRVKEAKRRIAELVAEPRRP
jgi:tetratricopeptide (TPR) repeat protein